MSHQGGDVVLPRGGLEGRQGRAEGHCGDGGAEGNGPGVKDATLTSKKGCDSECG